MLRAVGPHCARVSLGPRQSARTEARLGNETRTFPTYRARVALLEMADQAVHGVLRGRQWQRQGVKSLGRSNTRYRAEKGAADGAEPSGHAAGYAVAEVDACGNLRLGLPEGLQEGLSSRVLSISCKHDEQVRGEKGR